MLGFLRRYRRYKKLMKEIEPYGLKFSRNSNLDSIKEIFIDRIYTFYPDFMPKENYRIVDAGAQHGDYTLLCASMGSKVIAFEPLSRNIEILQENIRLNIKYAGLILVFPEALGSRREVKEMFYAENSNTDYVTAMAQTLQTDNKEMISQTDLDFLVIDRLDILKIDVEGFELDVLNGAINTIKQFHPKIIIETHSSKLESDVKSLLSSLGYELAHEGRSIYNPDSEFDKITNLFFAYNSI